MRAHIFLFMDPNLPYIPLVERPNYPCYLQKTGSKDAKRADKISIPIFGIHVF